jgi:zinc protease
MLSAIAALCLGSAPLSIPFERYTLPNGLTVILHQDKALPTVVVNLWFDVGSANERSRRTGFAHLFEHLMFMGTKEVPNGMFDKIMEQAGGSNNASTSNDFTNYFESGPSNLLETFLFLEADRLAHLPDDMTRAKVDLQRDVVKNERRQSYENRPYGMESVIVFDRLFPIGHPYHHPVIGSHADLTAASVDDVKAFFRSNYVPANASLVIAGDFEVASAKQLVDKYFGVLPRVEAPPKVTIPVSVLSKPVRVVQPDNVQQERVVLAYLAPGERRRGSAELDVLAAVLGVGKSSRLVKSLVVEQQLAESVEVSYEALRGQGVFVIAATAQGKHTGAELEKAIDLELNRLRDGPAPDSEVTRSVAQMTTQTLSGLESLMARANLLNNAELRSGDPGEVERTLLSRLEAVRGSGVVSVAKQLLSQPRLTLTFVPKAPVKGQK